MYKIRNSVRNSVCIVTKCFDEPMKETIQTPCYAGETRQKILEEAMRKGQ